MVNWNNCKPTQPLPPNSSENPFSNTGICSRDIVNPFSRRESYSGGEITTYKVFTLATWLLSVVTSVYYTLEHPHGKHSINRRIWEQNDHYPSGFTMNSVIASIFW